jgi:hypothetical protein
MKKRTLKEELERIHTITYGKQYIIESDVLNAMIQSEPIDTTKTIVDHPKKADFVGSNVEKFFNDLEAINEPLTQQRLGTMEHQKNVELSQIGLVLLGYELPRLGVDGLFGPETAEAVRKFKKDNNIVNEIFSNYQGGGNVKVAKNVNTEIDTQLQFKINTIASEYGKSFTITSAYRDPEHNKNIGGASKSQHLAHKAVDIVLSNATKQDTLRFVEISSRNGIGGIGVYRPGVIHIDVGPRRAWGPTHGRESVPSWAESTILAHEASKINVGYVSDYDPSTDLSGGEESVETITTGMIDTMISKLKSRGVTEEELQKLVDEVKTGGSSDFTDLDLMTDEGVQRYAEISNRFIQSREPNPLEVTGTMLANAAKRAFEKYHKYVPPELALAQLAAEGGIGNSDLNSRPIRTKNPFNVGNTDDGSNIYMSDVESGVNTYYSLIARRYLGKGKTAKDLVQDFVNHDGLHYAKPGAYEKLVNQIAKEVNSMVKTMP